MKLRILCLVILSSIVLSACGQEKLNNKPEQKIEQTKDKLTMNLVMTFTKIWTKKLFFCLGGVTSRILTIITMI